MSGVRRTWREQLAVRRPQVGLAWRTALAAGIALTIALTLPDSWRSHAAYAPLGAVMSTSFTIRGSFVLAARSMLGLVLGLALGLVVSHWVGHGTIAVLVVVVAGVVIGGWRLLGSTGTWVPTMALFVILVSGNNPVGFALANSVLALVGAVLGVLVLVVFPLTATTAAQLALRDLRDVLAQRLDTVADKLDGDALPTAPDWRDALPDLADPLWQARAELRAMAIADRFNWRTRVFHTGILRYDVAAIRGQLKALERIAVLVDDLSLTVADRERQDADPEIWPDLGGAARDATRRAVRLTARVLRSGEAGRVDRDALAAADAAAEALEQCVGPGGGANTSAARMAIAHSIRRALWAIADRSSDD